MNHKTTHFVLAGILLVLVVVAVFTLRGDITANVIVDECMCAPLSDPVCASLDQKLETYKNSCYATCAGAKIVYEASCASIPLLH